jgi:hypothetical protein
VNRRLLCAFLLISTSACGLSDRRTFQGVERASQAIQSAVDGKAALLRYRELLRTYAAELSVTAPRVTSSRGRAALADYQAALKNLNDLELVWEDKDTQKREMLPIREDPAGRIAREYDLPVNTNEPPSIYVDEAMAAIWAAALKHLRAASLALGSVL